MQDTYTDEEIHDVNNITVTIPDASTPIVVFFGSPASGKTLTLLRMIRFLEQNNYQVVPEALFRPQTDKHYTKMCAGLKDMAYSTYAPGGTDIISFMLVKVLDSIGRPLCQILEAPGEHYFDGHASLEFPTYINAIRTCMNKKIWVFFVEQDWGSNQEERNLYAQKICSMQGLSLKTVLFPFNEPINTVIGTSKCRGAGLGVLHQYQTAISWNLCKVSEYGIDQIYVCNIISRSSLLLFWFSIALEMDGKYGRLKKTGIARNYGMR